MSSSQPLPLILNLDSPQATLELVGGKGASLARMAAGRLPVPPGFGVTTAAYRRYVEENHIGDRILAAAAQADLPAIRKGCGQQGCSCFAASVQQPACKWCSGVLDSKSEQMSDEMGSDTSKNSGWHPTPYLSAPELAIPMDMLQLPR